MQPSVFSNHLSTLVELLRWRASQQPKQNAYTFLTDGEPAEAVYTYADLDRRARTIGAMLQKTAAAGDRALLLYPPGLDYIAAFWGCLYAGVVAVPVYPPHPARMERTFPRLRAIALDARPAVALTTSAILPLAEALFSQALDSQSMHWLATDSASDDMAERWLLPEIGAESLTFLQYTSGSTSTPKGVMLSHANLLHNLSLITRAFELSPDSRGVIWLPPYHDMGLIGGILGPLYAGFQVTLMSPVAFLQSPLRWLQTISGTKATISGGPNFAYDLCVRKTTPEQRAALDLSAWRVAFNGAEPVRPETLDRFVETFAPCGFRREAFYPCYGLAEATLMAAGGKTSAPPIVRSFQKAALEQNRVQEIPNLHKSANTLVGSGQSLPSQEIRIVNPQTRMACAPNEIGEIWLAGPSVAQGYWAKSDATETFFRAYTADSHVGPFLRTGDLGFVKGGELFVTGRLKDLIIIRGRNQYPQDIELDVEQCHASLRPGCSAAFSVDVSGEERLVVVQEIDRHHRNYDLDEVVQTIRKAVAERHELQPYAVVLIKTGSIPKTSSGKIQRHACKASFMEGSLEIVKSSILSGESDARREARLSPETIFTAALEAQLPLLEQYLWEQVTGLVGIASVEMNSQQSLSALGLDSLAAVELQHRIETELGVVYAMADLLRGPSIAQLAIDVLALWQPAGSESTGHLALAPLPASETPLAYGQRALWFLQQLAPESSAYNIATAFRIRADLNASALHSAFQTLVDRHPALRTTFLTVAGEPFQKIHDRVTVSFETGEASGWTEDDLRAWLGETARQPFDLGRGPLLKIELLKRSADEHVLLVVVHHIVVDYWSLNLLFRELAELYPAFQAGASLPLAPLAVHYTDYVRWQTQMLSGPRGAELWAYWQRQLAGDLPPLDLPTDRLRPARQTFAGALQPLQLNESLAARLKALAQAEGTTLYTLLLAAFQVCLYRYTGQEDILVGSPTGGRSRAQLANLVGYCVNPVVLRADLSGRPTFRQFLGQVRRTVLGALAHQDFPFPLLVERCRLARDLSRTPLFQTMFVFEKASRAAAAGAPLFVQSGPSRRMKLGVLDVEPMAFEQGTAQFDLTLLVEETEGAITAAFNYNTDLFEPATLQRMAEAFLHLLESVVADPGQRISDLSFLPDIQRQQLLMGWNEARRDDRDPACLPQRIEAQVRRSPHATALIAESGRLTYAELNERANRLAHHLRDLGVSPDSLVGIYLERSAELVVSLLAVLKAGGAYVPLDPTYPAERLAWILEDTQAPVVLTRESLADRLPASWARVVCLDGLWSEPAQGGFDNPASQIVSENLAYVLYTSGSTGRPKGVAITHRSAAALLDWAQTVFDAADLAGVLASTSICFDLSVFELFLPLSCGGAIILAENLMHVPGLAAASHVTLINTVPSAMADLLRRGGLPTSVGTVNLAGEPLPLKLVEQLYAQETIRQVFNLYGPSEDTTYSTYARMRLQSLGAPPIGRPITNTQAYVFDRHLQPVPIGVPGELYLGGAGLARGYLNRPDLTAERFVPNPFPLPLAAPLSSQNGERLEPAGERLYKTGDRVRYRSDGMLEYLGRLDHQVKLRGFRIELGEIESVLAQHPGVREAVVLIREDEPGERQLVAYAVPDPTMAVLHETVASQVDPQVSVSQLRQHLKQHLPDYMLPSAFVFLDSLPLTPNGKIDRRALPRPQGLRPELESPFVAPRTPTEVTLAGIWADVLKLERVGVYDNFFELGGHSLLATRVASQIREVLGAEPPLQALFEEPTVARLALVVEQSPQVQSGPQTRIQPRARSRADAHELVARVTQLSESETRLMLARKKKGQ